MAEDESSKNEFSKVQIELEKVKQDAEERIQSATEEANAAKIAYQGLIKKIVNMEILMTVLAIGIAYTIHWRLRKRAKTAALLTGRTM